MARRKAWMQKPCRNWMGIVPKPLRTPRRNHLELLPRVERLVAGGAIPKPVWFEAVMAHPPPLQNKFRGDRPIRLEWREEDRLRRIWQRRNPEASMHPKVLFLDEMHMPDGVAEHPADEFIKRQQTLMRRGLSEEESYRRTAREHEERRRLSKHEASDAHRTARSIGASPRETADSDGLAARLLRRFAEESRDSKMPYPRHWFREDGTWRGIGAQDTVNNRTLRALERQRTMAQLMEDMSLDVHEAADASDEDEIGTGSIGAPKGTPASRQDDLSSSKS